MKPLKVIIIGAGGRGMTYADQMAKLPDCYQIVAVAEPIDSRRNYIRDNHHLDDAMCFTDWKPLLALGKIADIAVIATMDREHFAPAMEAISLGYDLLLEKPIAPTPQECETISRSAQEKGVKVVVCTVLRYTPVFVKLKQLLDDGEIGRAMSINHEECVGNVHQSHSFVRGNWGNEGRSSSMLLQKSCHDMDILQWLLGKQCKKVQSFGTLSYFKKENAPDGAPDYCIAGCPVQDTCPYNAVKLYLDDKENAWFRSSCAREVAPTDDMIRAAISSTQYGKCVYKCDNDVVDHQTVNLLFEDDITVTFSMNAFNKGGRHIHIMGTKGEITAALDDDSPIAVYDFETKQTRQIPFTGKDGIDGGHGGGDEGIIKTLYPYLTGTYQGCSVPEIDESSRNHLIAFAAEQARQTNTVIDFEQYVKGF